MDTVMDTGQNGSIQAAPQQLTSSQRLLLALKEARLKLEEVERAQHEPIAVIGMGCRFPGGAHDPASFWRLLRNGQDAICEVPPSRWDINAYYDPDPNAAGKMYVRSAGFLTEPVDTFDPHFFGIAPREAMSLDPQQRLLLEVTWEALEHAGQSPAQLAGTRTGVFIGIGRDDYFTLIAPGGYLREEIALYGGIGNGYPFASGRLSYHLGLHGPNMALDTACSSSLVATDLAINSLRVQESDIAIVGGVQLMLSPAPTLALARLGALSPDGRCKTFDAAADGFSRGEGCGVIILKRLSDAVAAGDHIWAVLLGSAVNHDGHSSGLTVPNEQAQAQLIRQALQRARVEPNAVSYVEAHGTGTKLGDPIELGALSEVFGRERLQPLLVGAVKSNIGHLEAAAGMAGLIKTVLALHYNEIPPQLHFHEPNPHVDWTQLAVKIPTVATPWPVQGAQRIAGVSSFGMGGTNAHIVLAGAPEQGADGDFTARRSSPATPQLLTLSAKSADALRALAKRYHDHLTSTTDDLADICFTANSGRTHHSHCLALTGETRSDLQETLAAFLTGQEGVRLGGTLVQGQGTRSQPRPPLAFLFTGQGAQYVQMGQRLYATEPVFRQAINRCDELLRPYLGESLLQLLYPDQATGRQGHFQDEQSKIQNLKSKIDQTAYTQPALFMVEYALAQLWRAWGIEPQYVMGHSVGEYVAACIAGIFSLEDGLKLIAARGRLMQALPTGAMAAIMASPDQVQSLLAQTNSAGHVELAVINGPQSVVIAGQQTAVDRVVALCQQQRIKTHLLAVSHAFHSRMMEPMLAEFEQIARSITYAPPQIALVSNLTGALATAEIATASYWTRHVRQPVQFAQGMTTLQQAGVTCFLEIGPKPTLLGLAQSIFDFGFTICEQDTLDETIVNQKSKIKNPLLLPSLHPKQDDREQMLASLATLYVQGFAINWHGFYAAEARHKVVLPTYPFQRERYWVEAASALPPGMLKRRSAQQHPLLGQRQRTALKRQETVFEARLSASAPAYLAQHQVQGQVILPAAAYIEMALAAGTNHFGRQGAAHQQVALTLEKLSIPQALVLPAAEQDVDDKVVQLILTPVEDDRSRARFQIYSLSTTSADAATEEAIWTLHATGMIAQSTLVADHEQANKPMPAFTKLADEADSPTSLAVAEHYQRLQARGLAYGPLFRVVEKLGRDATGGWGEICLSAEQSSGAYPYLFHPLLLDGCFQVMAAIAPDDGKTYLPASYERILFYRSPQSRIWAQVTRHETTEHQGEHRRSANHEYVFQLEIFDQAGLVAVVEGLVVRQVVEVTQQERPIWRDWLYQLAWRPQPSFLPPAYMPAPHTLGADPAVAQWLNQQSEPLTDAEALIHQLEELSLGYILHALRTLGWALPVGQQITSGMTNAGQTLSVRQLADQLGIAVRHRRLLARLLAILAEAGYLQPAVAGWKVRRPVTDPATPVLRSEDARPDQQRQMQNEFILLDRCGVQLPAVLQGKVEPLDLLFPGGDLSTTAAIYQDSAMAQLSNTLVEKIVQAILAPLPSGRGVRILEIGAGTGGTTAYLLPKLAAASKGQPTTYTFTDISQGFLNQAQEKFSAYQFVEYRVLDIEQEPLAQGFTPHGYDLIIAANVLHATRDLHQTMTHVRQLLAPQGLVVLLEATLRRRWVDLTFGLTDGWWRFTDHSRRADHPLLTAEQWRALLTEAGFEDAQTLTQSATLAQTVISARAGAQVERLARPWLIFADQKGLGEQLAEELVHNGEAPTLVFADQHANRQRLFTAASNGRPVTAAGNIERITINPTVPEVYQQLCNRPWHGIVYLWSLDHAVPAAALTHELAGVHQQIIEPVLQIVQSLIKRQQAHLKGAGSQARLWLVTQGAVACPSTLTCGPDVSDTQGAPASTTDAVAGLVQAALWGVARVITLEHPEFHATAIDMEMHTSTALLLAELWRSGADDQVALRNGTRYVARLATLAETLPTGPLTLDITTRGFPDTLTLRSLARRAPGPGEVEIRIHAAGLNFRDLLNVLDLYPGRPPLGGECAGEVVAVGAGVTDFAVGDAVVALTLGSFADYVTVATKFVAHSTGLSFADAATLPTAFLTAMLCLQHYAHLQPGERVLIHAGAGGVGMAAIQLAQQIGAEVFATASPGKWNALAALGVRHIYHSHTLDFAEQILNDTGGHGVDVVLNSLTGAGFIEKSLAVLNPGGRFIEIAQRDVWSRAQMSAARPDVVYTLVNVAQLMDEQPDFVQATLRQVMAQAAAGVIRPLPHQCYPLQRAVDAFRVMQQGRHIGKLVLTPPLRLLDPLTFRPDGSYLITGGLGGLGLAVARWMVEHGARQLILVGRSKPNAKMQSQIDELTALGATVVVQQADVVDRAQMAALLADLAQPLRGVIHSVGVLDDGMLQRQSWARFATVMAPKVQGAWHLHTLTAELPLDFFVLFSSATSLLGNAGQANHAAANAFLDALAHYRRTLGLPALSINWGAWSEVGAAAQRLTLLKQVGEMIAPQQGLDALALLLTDVIPQAAVVPLDRTQRAQERPFFAELAPTQPPREQTEWLTALAAARPQERQAALATLVCDTVAKVLGIRGHPLGAVPLHEGFFDLGMDSLTSVELRNRLQKSLACELPTTLTFDYPTGAALVDYLAQHVLADGLKGDETSKRMATQLLGGVGSPVDAAPLVTPATPSDSALNQPLAPTGEDDIDLIAKRLAEKLGIEAGFHE